MARTNPSRMLGHFVDKRIHTGCQYDRDLAAARAAITSTAASEYGVAVTKPEALRRLNAEQVKSLSAANVMSPDLICIRAMAGTDAGPIIVEVSAGEFMGDALYGVTVYHVLPGERDRDWDASKACNSLSELLAALRVLNGGEA